MPFLPLTCCSNEMFAPATRSRSKNSPPPPVATCLPFVFCVFLQTRARVPLRRRPTWSESQPSLQSTYSPAASHGPQQKRIRGGISSCFGFHVNQGSKPRFSTPRLVSPNCQAFSYSPSWPAHKPVIKKESSSVSCRESFLWTYRDFSLAPLLFPCWFPTGLNLRVCLNNSGTLVSLSTRPPQKKGGSSRRRGTRKTNCFP